MREFYKRKTSETRYDHMTPLMIKQPRKSPKLRGRAAEVRGVIPFLVEFAARYSDVGGTEGTALHATRELAACYDCLSQANYNPRELAGHCRKFCIFYQALHIKYMEEDPLLWKIKPKFHLFQELVGPCGRKNIIVKMRPH